MSNDTIPYGPKRRRSMDTLSTLDTPEPPYGLVDPTYRPGSIQSIPNSIRGDWLNEDEHFIDFGKAKKARKAHKFVLDRWRAAIPSDHGNPIHPHIMTTSIRRNWVNEDEHFIDFEKPQKFVVDRWRAAVDTYKLSDADQIGVRYVTNAEQFLGFMRTAVQEAKDAKQWSRYSPLITISNIHGPLCQFEELIADADDESESTEYMDIIDDVDVSQLWYMSYLNVKLSTNSVCKLKHTASWMNDYRRQIELLISSLRQTTKQGGTAMRIEMSEIFDPALGILFESIIYLQKHYSDDAFVRNWSSQMQPKLKLHLEQMEGTVKHIRAMVATQQTNQMQEATRGELGLREREYPMDGSERAIFPVDNLPMVIKTDTFAGREREMAKIHNWLGIQDNKRLRTYLIYGRRGIGKTQIALEYTARYGDFYEAIFWIQCETAAALRQSFADIATVLELDGADKNGHFEGNLMKVKKWLKQTTKRWLLIYDNAERKNLQKGSWPVGSRGTILLTSRTYYNFFEDDQRQGETVSFFTPQESYDFLMAQLGQKWQDTHLNPKSMMYDVEMMAAKTLLKETGGLPLAIKHAARLILNKNIGMMTPGAGEDDSIHGFLGLFDKSSKVLPERQTEPRDTTVHSLDTIWSIAFNALSQNARAILQVLALVSPGIILIDLFQPGDQTRLTDKLAFCRIRASPNAVRSTFETVILSSPELQSAIEELIVQGMVTREVQSMAIHREVQEAVNYQGKDDLRESFDAATNLLYDAFPQQQEGRPLTEEKETCRRWVQHVIALATRYKQYRFGKSETADPFKGMKSAQTFAKLLASCAWYLYEIADYDECLNLVDCAAAACENQESVEFAHLMNTKGSTYYELNMLKPSREAHEVAGRLRKIFLGEHNAEYAISRSNLGNVQSAEGRYDEALELLREAASIREAIGDDAAVLLALNYLQIGRVHFLQQNYEEAYKEYQKCEGILMKERGRNTWFLAALYYAYGNREYALENYAVANQQYDRARRICQDMNPLHPLTAAVYYKMGCTDFKMNRCLKAMGNLERALNIAELRSPNVIDGTIARIQWKRAEVVLDNPTESPERRKEFRGVMDDMDLRQTTIAETMDIELPGIDQVEDREAMFDILVAGHYR